MARLQLEVAPARTRRDCDGDLVGVEVLDEADGSWEGMHLPPEDVLCSVARLQVGVDRERDVWEEGEEVLRGFALGWGGR